MTSLQQIIAITVMNLKGLKQRFWQSSAAIFSIALVITVTALYQGTRRTWRLPVIAVSGATFFWFLFVEILKIDQPPGIWPKLLASLGT